MHTGKLIHKDEVTVKNTARYDEVSDQLHKKNDNKKHYKQFQEKQVRHRRVKNKKASKQQLTSTVIKLTTSLFNNEGDSNKISKENMTNAYKTAVSV